MRRTALLLPLLLSWAHAAPEKNEQEPRGGKITWRADYARALKDASNTNKPVMLYFTADW